MSLLLLLIGTIVLVQGLRLWRNIVKARATGLRVVVTPLLETQVLAQLATPILRAIYWTHLDAGKGWPRWCRLMVKDWSWEDKRMAHEEYGDAFVCVSFESMICYSADAALAWDVMNRRYDFTKPRDKYKILEPYGPNVATAEGAEYRFHVRITAPAFSESNGINEIVWDETMRHTQALLNKWAEACPKNLREDVNALTLAVISLAGFGKKLESLKKQANDIPTGYKISFLQAISDTTTFMLAILVFPGWILKISPYAKAELAHSQLDKYLRQIIRFEKKRMESGVGEELEGPRRNLLNLAVKSSYEVGMDEKQLGGERKANLKKHAFTEDEVMGNLFIYLLAGYETTANSIAYGMIVLALEPALQNKLRESIEHVWSRATAQGRTHPSYKDDFAQLLYLYGFMYETFRLYPGVTLITKMCHESQEVTINNKAHVLPAGCRIYLSAPGVHYNEKYWDSPTELQPERWAETRDLPMRRNDHASNGDSAATSKSRKSATVAADKTRQMRGTLLTFSDGARVCLGRKFAQAEFMAFFTALLHDYEIGFAEGTDLKQARRDLNWKSAGKVTLTPSDHFPITLKKIEKGF